VLRDEADLLPANRRRSRLDHPHPDYGPGMNAPLVRPVSASEARIRRQRSRSLPRNAIKGGDGIPRTTSNQSNSISCCQPVDKAAGRWILKEARVALRCAVGTRRRAGRVSDIAVERWSGALSNTPKPPTSPIETTRRRGAVGR
jgi:hypothetical protein